MKRARNLLLTAMFATVAMLAGTAASPASAEASVLCNGEYFYLVMYKDASYGGPCLGVGGPGSPSGGAESIPFLGDISGSGLCIHPFDPSADWNDCVSSYRFSINSCHWHYSIYNNANYSALARSGDGGPNINVPSLPTGQNDAFSSVSVYRTSGCPLSPAP